MCHSLPKLVVTGPYRLEGVTCLENRLAASRDYKHSWKTAHKDQLENPYGLLGYMFQQPVLQKTLKGA